MAKSVRVMIACSLERVGGGLEGALKAAGWHLDAIDRVDGTLVAGKRGWFGYRKLEFTLKADGPKTVLTIIPSGVKQAVVTRLLESLGSLLQLPIDPA